MSLITKLSIIGMMSLISQISFGQKYSIHKTKKSYFGVAGGLNYSLITPIDRYSVLNSIPGNSDNNLEKEYDKFGKNRGAQFEIRYNYNFTSLMSIVVGLGYQSTGFNYLTQYSWNDTVGNNSFNRELHHLQKVTYFTLPVMARWDMTKSQFMPYLQGGIFMDFRHQAKKEIRYDNTIDGEETQNQISSSDVVSITDYTRKFNVGLIGGAGISYYSKYATFGLEANFKYSFIPLFDDTKRFSDLNGFALQYLDVFDQLKLNVLNIQFTVSIPLNNSVTNNILRRRRY